MVQKQNGAARSRADAPGERTRVRKADARRTSILRAAGRVFRAHGIAQTGMREIAEAADLSPGNLYYYFKNKAELLYFCQVAALDRMLAAAVALESGPLPAGKRLRRVIVTHLSCTLDEVDGAAAHTEVDMLPPDLRKRIVERRDRYETAVRRIVASGIKRQEFRHCDPALVARAILGALNWTARWYDPDGTLTASAVAEEFADYLVHGLNK
jgi:AcrR family transcriptional regulator